MKNILGFFVTTIAWVFLCGVSVNATTVYKLQAKSSGALPGFTLIYDDLNADRRVSLNEIKGFSGFHAGGQLYNQVAFIGNRGFGSSQGAVTACSSVSQVVDFGFRSSSGATLCHNAVVNPIWGFQLSLCSGCVLPGPSGVSLTPVPLPMTGGLLLGGLFMGLALRKNSSKRA